MTGCAAVTRCADAHERTPATDSSASARSACVSTIFPSRVRLKVNRRFIVPSFCACASMSCVRMCSSESAAVTASGVRSVCALQPAMTVRSSGAVMRAACASPLPTRFMSKPPPFSLSAMTTSSDARSKATPHAVSAPKVFLGRKFLIACYRVELSWLLWRLSAGGVDVYSKVERGSLEADWSVWKPSAANVTVRA